MRKGWIVILIILLLGIGIAFGILSYNKNKTENINTIENKQLANEKIENIIVQTSSVEEKISPNASILQKTYYTGCDHLIKKIVDIPETLVNKTKKDVQEYYNGWTIDSFEPNSITIYKEENGFCDQHYLVKEYNGVLAIYTLDENGDATLKKYTEISTIYLPEADLENLKQGIEVIGDTELNSFLGDFE